MRILVTDDSLFMRVTLGNILRKLGHEVFEAVDGEDAVKKYSEIMPDIVTLDITMPQKDGKSALKEIKQLYPEARVIIVSAMGQDSNIKEAIKNGAKDFIVKPFNQDRIMQALKKIENL